MSGPLDCADMANWLGDLLRNDAKAIRVEYHGSGFNRAFVSSYTAGLASRRGDDSVMERELRAFSTDQELTENGGVVRKQYT